MGKNNFLAFVLFLSFNLLNEITSAQTTSWKGTSSTAWNTASNWTNGVPSSSVNAIIGDAYFTGANHPSISATATVRDLTIGTDSTVTLTITKKTTISGNLTIGSHGTLAHNSNSATHSITLQGNFTNSGTYSTTSNNATVILAGVTQSIGGSHTTSFKKLTINSGSTITLSANVTVTQTLTVDGTLDPNEPTYTITLTGATFTLSANSVLKVKASTFAGNYTVNPTANATSTVDYAATTTNQTVSNGFTYGNLTISGGMTKTLAGNLPNLSSSSASGGRLTVTAGTLNLSSYTANRNASGGILTVSNGATLKIGGTNSIPSNYATHTIGASSTIEYSGTNQTVSSESYGNLTLSSGSGAAVKTMPGSTLTISGNLTSAIGAGSSVSFTAGAAINVTGTVSIGSSTTFSAGSYTHTFTGNFANSGTFTGSTSTVTMNGAGTSISGSGTTNFYNLTISAAGITASSSVSFNVDGNLSTSGAGTFTHISGGSGTLTMGGTSKTISGSEIVFNNLTVSGTVSTSSATTIAGDLSVSNSFTTSSCITTLSGTSKTISGAGTLTLNALTISGSVTTSKSFSLSSNLTVTGSFSASSGTIAFNGTSTLNGTANLYNVTLNGTSLTLGASANLGIANTFTVTAGTFYTTVNTPNTVTFNGSGAQSVNALTYYKLDLSNGGTKTATGAITLNGNLTINSSVTFNAGSYAHVFTRDIINSGTFTAGTSTIQLTGSIDASITGATTFNILTIDKSASGNVVTLNSNVSVATIQMTTGEVHTGSNTLTITSSRTGSGIILGIITRTHTFSTGTAYGFESQYNTITFTAVSGVSSVTVTALNTPVNDYPFGGSVNREYDFSISSGTYTANVQLHYNDADLNGNVESSMRYWKFVSGTSWVDSSKSSNSTTNNYVQKDGLTSLNGRWTLSDYVNAVNWTGAVSSAWENPANWAFAAGTPNIPPGSADIVELGAGTYTNQPTITTAVVIRGITFNSPTQTTVTIGAGGSLTSNGNLNGNITGNWTLGNATHNFNIGAQTMSVGGSLVLSDGNPNHNININIGSGTVTVVGSLTQSGGANVTFSGPGLMNISGDYIHTGGTFTPSTGTVKYNGTSAQSIAGLGYYNLLVEKASGVATSSSAVRVANNLSLSSAAFYQTNDSLIVTGNITINSGTTLKGNTANIFVQGNWVNSGTFTPSSSTVIFNGTGSQTIDGTTFNNLTINKSSGTATANANITINSDLTITNGTLDISTYTANRSVTGGIFTMSNGSTLKVGGANNFPSNYSTNTLSSGSTVEYHGTVAQTVNAINYGHLTFTNGTSNAKTLSGSTTVTGNLIINSGATLSASSYSLTAEGNWANSGTFTPSTGTVSLTGSSRTLSGSTTFNALIISGSYTASGNLTVNGAATLSGTYAAGSTTVTMAGDFTNTGTLTSSGTVTFSGTGAQALQINSGLSTTGTVNFNGTVAPIITSSNAPTFYTLNVNNTGGVTAATDWRVNGACTIASGATLDGGGSTLTFYGNFTNNGTVTSTDTFNFTPSSTVTVSLMGTNCTSTGTLNFGGSGAITLSGTPTSIENLMIANTNGSGVTLPTSWTINGNLTVMSGASFNLGTALAHTLNGTLNCNGTLDGGTSTLSMNGTSEEIKGIGTAGLYGLTIASGAAITLQTEIQIKQNFTDNATFTANGFEVEFTGTGASTISGTTTPVPIDVLTVTKTSATVTTSNNLSNISLLTINSGTLDVAAKTISQNAGLMHIESGATLKVGGTNNIPTFDNYALDNNSTVEFNGTTQSISSTPSYGNVTISTAGTKTAGGDLTVNGTFNLAEGTFTGGNNSHNMKGNWNMTAGTFTNTNTMLIFNGTGSQTISSTGSFNNMTVNKSSGSMSLLSDVTVNGTLTLTSGYISTGSYKVIIPSSASVSRTSGYVYGNLQKAFSTLSVTRTFEIGNSTGYTPVTVTFGVISVSGNLIASAADGDHSDIINSSVDANKSVNLFWTLTNSGISFTSYNSTFNFNSSDIDAGAGTSNFIVALNNSGWTFPTVGTKTSTSTQCTGASSFGDFQIGEYGQKVWDGGAGTNNWGTANNWNPNGVPSSGENVILSGANTIDINVAAVCKDLTLSNSGLTLTILSTKSLSVSGNLLVSSGTLNTAASFPTVTGTTTISGGTVGYTAAGAQTVSAINYYDLALSNSGTKTFASGTTGIGNSLTLSGSATANTTTNSATVDFNKAGSQTVNAINYHNLTLSNSGIKTLESGTIGIAGTLSVTGSASFNAPTNSSAVSFNGIGSQTIPAIDYYDLTLATSGTKTFSPGITQVSNGLTVTGSASADATTNSSTLQFNGSGTQTIPVITYYNLTSANGGTKNLGGDLTINGVLTISGTTTLNATASNYGITIAGNWVNNGSAGTTFNAQSGTVTFNGTTTISGSATTTFKNIIINSGKTLTASSSTTIVNGNFQNNGTFANNSGTVTFNGTTIISGSSSLNFKTIINNGTVTFPSSLSISGDLTNNSTINHANGTVTFNGSSNQTITSGGSALYNVTVNNSAGVTLADDLTLSNVLSLTSGLINTGSYRVVISSTADNAVQGYSSSSYVNGNLRRNILNNTLTYPFPVGTVTKYTLAEVGNHNLNGVSYIDASFGSKPGNDANLTFSEKGTRYTSINNAGVWYLVPNANPSGGSYDLKCWLNAFSGLADNSFSILSRPDASTDAADWNTAGGTLNHHGGLGRVVANGYALRKNLTSFSQKGIGQTGFILPITLSYFDVKKDGGNVLLNWRTEAEINNDHFEVELGTDFSNGNLSFEKIGEVSGQTTTLNSTKYQFTDYSIDETATRYYRLKQVNADSTFSYSEIKTLQFEKAATNFSDVYPNPATNHISFELTVPEKEKVMVRLFNSAGQIVKEKSADLDKGVTKLNWDISRLATGVYFMEVSASSAIRNQSKRIIKN